MQWLEEKLSETERLPSRNSSNKRGESLWSQCTKERSNDGDLFSYGAIAGDSDIENDKWIGTYLPLSQVSSNLRSGAQKAEWIVIILGGATCTVNANVRLDDCTYNWMIAIQISTAGKWKSGWDQPSMACEIQYMNMNDVIYDDMSGSSDPDRWIHAV